MSSDDERSEMDPRRYYDSDPEAEWERLDADPVGRLEFESTVDATRRERSVADVSEHFLTIARA